METIYYLTSKHSGKTLGRENIVLFILLSPNIIFFIVSTFYHKLSLEKVSRKITLKKTTVKLIRITRLSSNLYLNSYKKSVNVTYYPGITYLEVKSKHFLYLYFI